MSISVDHCLRYLFAHLGHISKCTSVVCKVTYKRIILYFFLQHTPFSFPFSLPSFLTLCESLPLFYPSFPLFLYFFISLFRNGVNYICPSIIIINNHPYNPCYTPLFISRICVCVCPLYSYFPLSLLSSCKTDHSIG